MGIPWYATIHVFISPSDVLNLLRSDRFYTLSVSHVSFSMFLFSASFFIAPCLDLFLDCIHASLYSSRHKVYTNGKFWTWAQCPKHVQLALSLSYFRIAFSRPFCLFLFLFSSLFLLFYFLLLWVVSFSRFLDSLIPPNRTASAGRRCA